MLAIPRAAVSWKDWLISIGGTPAVQTVWQLTILNITVNRAQKATIFFFPTS